MGDGRDSWTVEPTAQPRLEIVNSLPTASVLNKNRKSLPKNITHQVGVLHEPQFHAVDFISRFFHRQGAQKYTDCTHRFLLENNAKEGGTSWGRGRFHSHHHSVSHWPGPLTPAEVLLLLSSKNHHCDVHCVHIFQPCSKRVHFSPWENSQEKKTERVGSQHSVTVGDLPAQVLQLGSMWPALSCLACWLQQPSR